MKVPMFDMRAELAAVRTDIDAAIARVLDSSVLIGGDEVTGSSASSLLASEPATRWYSTRQPVPSDGVLP